MSIDKIGTVQRVQTDYYASTGIERIDRVARTEEHDKRDREVQNQEQSYDSEILEKYERVTKDLDRLKELSYKAEKEYDTSETDAKIEEIKRGISEELRGTEYASVRLIDGSVKQVDVDRDINARNMPVMMEDSTLETLGIEEYGQSNNYDTDVIDDAISSINDSISYMSKSDAKEPVIRSNHEENIVFNNRQLSDIINSNEIQSSKKIVLKATEEQKEQVMNTYRLMTQGNMTQNDGQSMLRLFA